MALTIDESWIRERVKLKHDHLDDVKSLSLPGTYQEKISSLGSSLRSFTRLKNLDLSRNSISSLEGLEGLKLLENLNLYYNNVSTIRDLNALRHLNNLKELDLRLNPVTKNEPDYRLHIVHMLPNLKRLDDRSVRDSERRAALMHFTSDQASDFNKVYSNKTESDRVSVPRSDMVRNLGARNTVFEDDDVAILDMITRTSGDLRQPRRVTGSSSRQPDLEDFNRDEIHNMEPYGTPRQHRHNGGLDRKTKSPRIKDRVYVQFEDDVRCQQDDLMKYTDESEAYSSLNTRGHFTANPLVNGHGEILATQRPIEKAAPPNMTHGHSHEAGRTHGQSHESGRTFDFFSPEKRIHENAHEDYDVNEYDGSRQRWTSPRQSQGPIADKIGQSQRPMADKIVHDRTDHAFDQMDDPAKDHDPSDVLFKLLDLVDRYWNGSKSLHRNMKFQSLARKLLPSDDRSINQPTPVITEKLRTELSERTAELSRLRDQMAEQHRELESLRSRIKSHEMVQENFHDTSKELNAVKSKLREVEEQNVILKAKASSLEARNFSATEQEKQLGELLKRNSSLEEKVQSFNTQMTQQNKNLQQLQELTDMLQESHRSLVATNDHLLRELDETRQRHSTEVQQMQWSYDKLKHSMDWLPNGSR